MQNRYDSRQQRFKDWLHSSRNKEDAPRKRKHKLSGCNDAGKKGDERISHLLSVLIFLLSEHCSATSTFSTDRSLYSIF